MAEIFGTISAAASLVDLIRNTIRGYKKYDEKFGTLKEELECFEGIAVCLYRIIYQKRIDEQWLTRQINQYNVTIVDLKSKLQQAFDHNRSKLFLRTKKYVRLLVRDKEITALRQKLRSQQHDMVIWLNILIQRGVAAVHQRMKRGFAENRLRHRSSEDAIYSLQSDLQRLEQSVQEVKQNVARIREKQSVPYSPSALSRTRSIASSSSLSLSSSSSL